MRFHLKIAFLSNFFLRAVNYGGKWFKSPEHAYQYEKVAFDGDRFAIQSAVTPGAAKRLGRAAIACPGWEQRKRAVMLDIVRAKFAEPDLADRLATLDGEIVEHNHWHDNYWGSCTCPNCGDKGESHLGRILMQVRDEVRQRRLL